MFISTFSYGVVSKVVISAEPNRRHLKSTKNFKFLNEPKNKNKEKQRLRDMAVINLTQNYFQKALYMKIKSHQNSILIIHCWLMIVFRVTKEYLSDI